MQRNRSAAERILETEKANVAVVGILTILSFALRFYKINHPDQVVCALTPYHTLDASLMWSVDMQVR